MKLFFITLALCAIRLGSAVDPFNITCKEYTGDDLPVISINSTYYYPQIKRTWHEAYNYCRAKNMQLATPSTKQKNTELKAFLKSTGIATTEHVWIAGTDEGHEGKFVWRTTGAPVDYADWYTGNPSNSYNDAYGYENCMELYLDYQWDDRQCGYTHYFVCERTRDPELEYSQLCKVH